MAKIVRETQLVFGSNAGFQQIAQFGSLAASSPTFTTNIATIQGLSNYLVGWFDAVIGGNSPAIEDMNALCYLYAYQLAYILQSGVQEYDSGTTYYIGSLANDGLGNVYVSIADNNTGHALTNSTYWLPPGATPSTVLSTSLTIPSGYNYNASFLTVNSSNTLTIAGTAVFSGTTIVNGTVIVTGTGHSN